MGAAYCPPSRNIDSEEFINNWRHLQCETPSLELSYPADLDSVMDEFTETLQIDTKAATSARKPPGGNQIDGQNETQGGSKWQCSRN